MFSTMILTKVTTEECGLTIRFIKIEALAQSLLAMILATIPLIRIFVLKKNIETTVVEYNGKYIGIFIK